MSLTWGCRQSLHPHVQPQTSGCTFRQHPGVPHLLCLLLPFPTVWFVKKASVLIVIVCKAAFNYSKTGTSLYKCKKVLPGSTLLLFWELLFNRSSLRNFVPLCYCSLNNQLRLFTTYTITSTYNNNTNFEIIIGTYT